MDDFTEVQKSFMHHLFAQLSTTINEKTSEIRGELSNIKEEIAFTINNLSEKVDKLEKENKSLLKNKIFLERKIRKNNIIIFGIDLNTPIVDSIIRLFNDLLEVPVKITDLNDFYRLNARSNKQNSPVLVEFISYQQKLQILRSAKKLKGQNISIAKDLCIEDRESNKILLKHQKEARNKGITAFIKGDKLIVENESYTTDQLLSTETVEESAIETETQGKIVSAPSTPNPKIGQKRFLQEPTLEKETQEPKKASNSKVPNEKLHRVKTRSNSITNK